MTRLAGSTLLAAIAGAAAISLVLGACAPENEGGPGSSDTYKTPEVDTVPIATAAQVIPFSAYELAYPDLERMQQAQATLLNDCMRSRNAATELAGDYLRPNTGPLLWGGPLGTLELGHAETFGYKAASNDPFSLGPGFYIRQVTNISPLDGDVAVQLAFFGPPSDASAADETPPGCVSEIEKSIDTPIADISDVAADVMNLAYNDSRVQESMAAWSECMRARGLDYVKVQEGVEQFVGKPLSQKEALAAVQDVECTAQSGWANMYYAVLADYQSQAISNNQKLFDAYRLSQQERLERIEALVSQGR